MDYQVVLFLSDGTEIGSELIGYAPTFQQIRKGLVFYGGVAYRLDKIENGVREEGKRIEANYE